MTKENQAKIPKLELENFTFSPPGPMGWSFSEYENMLDNPDQIVLNQETVNNRVTELKNMTLVEFPINKNDSDEEDETDSAYPYQVAVASQNDEESSVFEEKELGIVAEIESEELESVAELEEEVIEPEPEIKKRIIIITMDSPKPPWISPSVQKSKINR